MGNRKSQPPTPRSKGVAAFVHDCCVNTKRRLGLFSKASTPSLLVSTNKHFQAATNRPQEKQSICPVPYDTGHRIYLVLMAIKPTLLCTLEIKVHFSKMICDYIE